jgi:hypothetical protein
MNAFNKYSNFKATSNNREAGELFFQLEKLLTKASFENSDLLSRMFRFEDYAGGFQHNE